MGLPYAIEEGTTAHRAYRWVPWGLFVLLALLAPFWAVQNPSLAVGESTFTMSLGNLNHAVAYMVGVLGLGLLVGYNGQISLGNSFFMGVGGYLTATLLVDEGWAYPATLLVVLPATFIVGMLIGIPALRIRGLYLALTTLGLAAVFPSIVRLDQLRDRTGGANGKRVDADLEAPDWLPLEDIADALSNIPIIGEWAFGEGRLGGDADDVWVYMILAALTAASFWVVRNLVYSRPGRSIIAIRDNETGAAVSGVNVRMTKTLTFGVSAALGGLAGSMYAIAIGFVAPDVFGINLAIFLIVGLVVGGVGTLSGAVIGGLVIIFIPAWSSQIASVPAVPERYLRGPTGTFVLGVLLIVLTFFLPGGIVYGVRRLRARVFRVIPAGTGDAAAVDDDITAADAAAGLLQRGSGASALLDEADADADADDVADAEPDPDRSPANTSTNQRGTP